MSEGSAPGDEPLRLPASRGEALRELAVLFTKLGFTAFGGPAAHIAMMENEVVRRRRWMKREELLDLVGATNLIPGPASTELAIHIGHRLAGFAGLVVAGACFIVPAALITAAIALAYVRFGSLPQAEGILYGVKPAIIAVVVQALWSLSRTALKTRPLIAVGVASLAASVLGAHELLVIFGSGAVIAAARWIAKDAPKAPPPSPPPSAPSPSSAKKDLAALVALGPASGAPFATLMATAAATTASAVPFGLTPLFLFFLKVGSVLFGSGYVLLAFLRADLVDRFRWMTEAQLLDAVAVGQVTPGPVFTTATFIGYVLGGAPGALLATLGIFLPAFFFVAVSGPLVPRLRRSRIAGAFLDGVNVASLALMFRVTAELARAAVIDWISAALCVLSAVLLLRYKVSSIYLVLGGALLGLAANALR